MVVNSLMIYFCMHFIGLLFRILLLNIKENNKEIYLGVYSVSIYSSATFKLFISTHSYYKI